MIKYTIRLDENNELKCTKMRSYLPNTRVSEIELLKLLDRVDLNDYYKRIRTIPIAKYDTTKEDIILISKKRDFVIKIKDYQRTLEAIRELQSSHSRIEMEQREISRRTPTVGGVVAASTLVIALLCKACGQEIDEPFIEGHEKTTPTISVETAIQGVPIVDDEEENQVVIETTDHIVTTEYPSTTQTPVLTNLSQSIEGSTDVVDSYMEGITIARDIQGVVDPGITANLDTHMSTIERVSSRRGISVGLLKDIVSQETSGGDNNRYGTNLVQFEWRFWNNPNLIYDIYNVETGSYDKIVFTNDIQRFANRPDVMVITKDDLNNEFTNLAVCSIILQIYGNKYYPNVLWTIQAYNNGETHVNRMLRELSDEMNMSVPEILNLDYDTTLNLIRKKAIRDANDNIYVEEVLKHLDPSQAIDGINDEYVIVLGPDKVMSLQMQVNRDFEYVQTSEGKGRK
ncbi:MAG: hypothetical protein K5666_03655 [Bacilli bacterium]|nr:hypothetical protein [Bacilli bacterium]